MSSSNLIELAPVFIFLAIFGPLFFLVEMIIIALLNQIEKHHWVWMVDVLLYEESRHRPLFKFGLIAIILLLIIALFLFTPLISILVTNSPLKTLAIGLLIILAITFLVSIYGSHNLAIERRLYSVIFMALSVVSYGMVLSVAQVQYKPYAEYFQSKIIQPAEKELRSASESSLQKKLLTSFRQEYYSGNCKAVDYTKQDRSEIITQLIWVANEAGRTPGSTGNTKEILKGWECQKDDITFILSSNNKWYWVSEVNLH